MVTLYTRPGCHLCDEVLESIVALRGEAPPFQLRAVNIGLDTVRNMTGEEHLKR